MAWGRARFGVVGVPGLGVLGFKGVWSLLRLYEFVV